MRVRRFAFAKPTLIVCLTVCFTLALGFLNAAPEPVLAVSRQGDPSVVGQWSPVFSWGNPGSVAIHTSVLPNGKVLTWQRVDSLLSTDTFLWDPATGSFNTINNPRTHMFCSGHSLLPDGRLLVAGGHVFYDGDGDRESNIFDYTTNTWSASGDMKLGRWYPTNTTLGNGEVLTVSGIYCDQHHPMVTTVTSDNSYDLYFNGAYQGSGSDWTQAQAYTLNRRTGKNVVAIRAADAGGIAGLLADIRMGDARLGSDTTWKVSLTAPANWADPNFDDSGWATATDYGGYGVGPWATNVAGMPLDTPGRWIWSSNRDAHDVVYIRATFNSTTAHSHVNNSVPEVWQSSGVWRQLSGANMGLPLYPWVVLAPNGRVFYTGPDSQTWFLNTSGAGAWTPGPASRFGYRDYGSAVMYDAGKVLIAGGGAPTNTAEVIDLNTPTPAWRFVGSMAFARRQMNATVLPDGKVLATGGTASPGFNDATGSVFAAEMWDPATETWTTVASMQERRLYHSGAVLLPDGRVLSAGGGQPAGEGGDSDHPTAEIYSPPYLFRGARPTITSAPASAGYGQTFFVQTPDAASVAKVTLVRLSSVTHSFNQNQRFNRLNFTLGAGGLNVTAPADGNVCPPGHYMLFILNGNGVPSVAKIIKIEQGAATGSLVTTVTSDNSYDLYFNGTYRGSGSNWMQAQTYNLSMQAGKNVLAVRAADAGGIAGLLADLTVNGQRTGSNTTWKVSRTAPANWADPNFDDSGWATATDYGGYGVGPWATNVAGMPLDTPGRWIWSSNNDSDDLIYVRVTVGAPQNATAIVTSDNSYDLYFNGSFKGSGSNWMQAQSYTLPTQTGKNVLAIRAADAGGLAGLLAELQFNGQRMGSNVTWKVSLSAPANWADVNFDDTGWASATDYGGYGIGPWGASVAGMPPDTPAKWIWSFNNDLHDVVFVRVSFNGP
ncbi:MAG TPA: galactose oxidase-like domain-containing protein [Pyrinomonadaceae bacterium]